jgi:hypothetical protein
LTGALLALAMLASPTFAQLSAAETCRSRCKSAVKAAHASCCGGGADVRTQAGDGRTIPDGKPSDASLKLCPGCNGRPLVSDTPRLTITLDPAPIFVAVSGELASASVDVPFAIFHPPRA